MRSNQKSEKLVIDKNVVKELKKLGFDYYLSENSVKSMDKEDRRFLMGILQQDINTINTHKQFRLTVYLSYTAIFISVMAFLVSSSFQSAYAYTVLILFFVGGYYILHHKSVEENKLYRGLIGTYNDIRNIHFNYLKDKVKLK